MEAIVTPTQTVIHTHKNVSYIIPWMVGDAGSHAVWPGFHFLEYPSIVENPS